MASKEATKEEKNQVAEVFAFELNLSKAKIGEKTTNPQVKSKVAEAFMGWGAHDSTRVQGEVGADRTVVVFFARLFGKGQPAWDNLKKGEKVTVKVYDEDVDIRLTDAKPSGGGATTGTAARPKKEQPKGAKGAPKRERDARPKREAEAKDGEAKNEKPTGGPAGASGAGGAGRGRGRPKKEEKKESFQRGRANVGGKLGPVSQVRLAKQAKEARDKENADRIARGEEPLPEPKKKEEEEEPKKDAKGGKDAKKEGGKKEAGKKDAAAGKKEGAKAEGGKKEAAKKAK